MRRRWILILAVFFAAACTIFVMLAVIWQHDPTEAPQASDPGSVGATQGSKAMGPLRRHPANPRYFAGWERQGRLPNGIAYLE